MSKTERHVRPLDRTFKYFSSREEALADAKERSAKYKHNYYVYAMDCDCCFATCMFGAKYTMQGQRVTLLLRVGQGIGPNYKEHVDEITEQGWRHIAYHNWSRRQYNLVFGMEPPQ